MRPLLGQLLFRLGPGQRLQQLERVEEAAPAQLERLLEVALLDLGVDRLALGDHLGQRGGLGRWLWIRPIITGVGSGPAMYVHGRLAQPRGEDPVERARRAAALHVAQHGDARLDARAVSSGSP